MKCSILKKSSKKLWITTLNRFPQEARGIFFYPEYLELYEKKGESANCFICEEGEKIFLYPFLICNIPNTKNLKDIKTAYGYGGPVSNSSDSKFIKKAYENLRYKLLKENVITELIKFNPFIYNKNIINNYDGKIFNAKIIVYIDLKNNNEEEILNNYKKSCKKKLKKINTYGKLNIKIENSEDALFKFKKIYDESMLKLKAEKSYFKNKNFYKKIYKNLKNNFFIFSLYEEKKILTSQLLLFDKDTINCHMYGSTEYAKEKSLIVFSYHKLIIWAKNIGFNKINFGGGRNSDPKDTLLNFKQNFSKTYFKYFIGEKILNKKTYDNLCAKQNNKNNNKLFRYRN